MSTIQQETKRRLGADVEPELYARFEQLARENERPVAAELRLAARRHLENALTTKSSGAAS